MSNKFQNEDFKSEEELIALDGSKSQLLNTTKIYSPKSDEVLESVLKKNKDDATVAPNPNNDISDGFEVGSRWIDVTSGRVYYCVDNTAAGAVWKLAGLGDGGPLSDLQNKGDLITHDGSNIQKVAVGDEGAMLVANPNASTGLEWQQGLTAKGDLLTHTGTSLDRVGVGAEGHVLTADPATPTGLAWKKEEAAENFNASLINGIIVPHWKWDGIASESGEDNPDIPVVGNASCARWTICNGYLAVTYNTFPFLTVYKRSENNLVKLEEFEVPPPAAAHGVAWSNDCKYLTVTHDTAPFISIYKKNVDDTFTKLNDPDVLPTGIAFAAAFSHDGQFLSVSHAVTPFVTIYQRSGDAFTKLANPNILPTGIGRGTCWNPAGNILAVAHEVSPWVSMYERSGTTFTKLANPATIPTGIGRDVTFNPAGNLMVVAHAVSPWITIYSVAGTTFTKLANPAALPTGIAYGAAFGYPANIFGHTEDFDNAMWVKTRTTIIPNDIVPAPEGSFTAEKIVEDTEDNSHTVSQSVPVLNGSWYTFSVYLRGAERNRARLTMSGANFGGTAPSAIFNLATGVVHSSVNCITEIEPSNDGWWRCSIKALCVQSGLTSNAIQLVFGSSTLLYPGDGTSGIHAWGAQFETGQHLSSYTKSSDPTYYLAAAHAVSPFVTIYGVSSTNVFTKLVNPALLPTGIGNAVSFSIDGGLMAIAHDTLPFITLYEKTDDVFNRIPNPAPLPTGVGYDTAYSPNGQFLAVGHATSPFITIYEKVDSTYTKLPNPASIPNNSVVGVAWHPSGNLLTVAYASTPWIITYKRDGNTFTRLPNPMSISPQTGIPTGIGRRVEYSPDGQMMAVVHDTSPYITTYSVLDDGMGNYDFLQRPNPNILPAGVAGSWTGGQDLSWSPDSNLLAVGCNSFPFLMIYQRNSSNNTLVKLPNPPVLPSALCRAVRFSPDGQFLFAGQNVSPWLRIWKVDGTTFTATARPNINPTGLAYRVQFSYNSRYAIVSHNTAPWFTIYKKNGGDSWKKLTNPALLPTGIGYSVSFLPGSVDTFAVASSTTPFIHIYDRGGFGFSVVSSKKETPIVKLANPATLPSSTGQSAAFSPNGKFLAVVHGSASVRFVSIYRTSGAGLVYAAGGATASSWTAHSVVWTADSQYIAIGRSVTAFLLYYSVNQETGALTSATVSGDTGSTTRGLSISPNSLYIVATHDASPFVSIYQRTGNVLNKLPNPTILPTGIGRKSCWSPDGKYLVITHDNAPFVTVYEVADGVFAKIPDLDELPQVNARSTSWTPDGQILVIGHAAAPFLSIYKVEDSVFQRIDNPKVMFNGIPTEMSWAPTDIHLLISTTVAPFMAIYERDLETNEFIKCADPAVQMTGQGNGCHFSYDGRLVAIAHSITPFISAYRTSQLFRKLPRGVAKFTLDISAD
jgi:6-phosphogluconolactonase (cycloisomerase 2 family)